MTIERIKQLVAEERRLWAIRQEAEMVVEVYKAAAARGITLPGGDLESAKAVEAQSLKEWHAGYLATQAALAEVFTREERSAMRSLLS